MKYKTIYIDPPWKASIFSRQLRPNQLCQRGEIDHYPRMTDEEIKGLPVRDLADDICHLYIWSTHTKLPKVFEIIDTWDFKYNCCFTWDKGFGMCPFGFMWSTEFLLFAQRKGKWSNLKKLGIKTMIHGKPGEHSRKPIEAYEIIEAASFEPRIEMFARSFSPLFPKRDGWDTWGNEAIERLKLND